MILLGGNQSWSGRVFLNRHGNGGAGHDQLVSVVSAQRAGEPDPRSERRLVRIRAGVNPSLAYRSLELIDTELNALPNDEGSAGGVVSVLRPAAIVNFRAMGASLPYSHRVSPSGHGRPRFNARGSVRRRRRDLALLKALGFTQRQLAA